MALMIKHQIFVNKYLPVQTQGKIALANDNRLVQTY